jgi:hypothetical protein
MTASTSANVVRFGPGVFTLGTAPGVDYSCQVKSMAVNANTDKGDPVTPLCGVKVPGSRDYSYALAGTLLQDFGAADGLQQYTWEHKGEAADFTFTPAASATTSIAGTIVIDPLNIGDSGAVFGDVLTVDFEFECVGEPDVTWPAGGAAAGDQLEAPEVDQPAE